MPVNIRTTKAFKLAVEVLGPACLAGVFNSAARGSWVIVEFRRYRVDQIVRRIARDFRRDTERS